MERDVGFEPGTFPLQVFVDAPERILPSEPTANSHLFLSSIDQALIYTVETVHFFAANPQKPADNIVEDLRDGLRRLLVPYHFMAGRLKLNAEQRRLEIHCNRAGALFAGASAAHAIVELGDLSYPNPEFKKLVLQAFDAKKIEELPLLLIQITRFKCGGFAIGLGTNHTLVDGFAAVDFMLNYASIVRGEGLVVYPNPDRSCFKARQPLQIKYDHSEFIKLSELPEGVALSFTDPNFGCIPGDISGNMLPPVRHIFRLFPLSGRMVDSLKKRAMEDGLISKCSSFDVVAAHVWQARTKALGLEPEEPVSIFFAVDVRNRMVPPLPKGFAGNAVFSAHATASARELKEEALSFCVGKIQGAVGRVTDDYVRSAIDSSEVEHGVPGVMGGSFFLAAWGKLGFKDADFGWGKPSYCGPVVNGRVEFVLLLPTSSSTTSSGDCGEDNSGKGISDGCSVYIALEKHAMNKFQHLMQFQCN